MPDDFSSSVFAEHLHTSFQLLTGGEPIPLELVLVKEARRSGNAEQFSVIFRGPRARPFQQGTHGLTHEKLGRLDLFLVPIGRDETGYRYEAVFSRLLPAKA
jgi:hypothetical protein